MGEATFHSLLIAGLKLYRPFFAMPGGQALGYCVAGADGEPTPGERRYNGVWYRMKPDLPSTLTDRNGRVNPCSLPPGATGTAAARGLLSPVRYSLPSPFANVFAAEPRPFVQAIFDKEPPHMVDGWIALVGDAGFIARSHTAMGVAKAAGDAMMLARAVALAGSRMPAARSRRGG